VCVCDVCVVCVVGVGVGMVVRWWGEGGGDFFFFFFARARTQSVRSVVVCSVNA